MWCLKWDRDINREFRSTFESIVIKQDMPYIYSETDTRTRFSLTLFLTRNGAIGCFQVRVHGVRHKVTSEKPEGWAPPQCHTSIKGLHWRQGSELGIRQLGLELGIYERGLKNPNLHEHSAFKASQVCNFIANTPVSRHGIEPSITPYCS